jgi:hypothetical protein
MAPGSLFRRHGLRPTQHKTRSRSTSPCSAWWVVLPCLALFGMLLGSARSADAESLRLRSGQVLQAESVEVLDTGFRVELRSADQTTFVEFPFDRFAPKAALKIFDRHTEALDPRRKLQGAELALSLGLLEEAKRRYTRAATLDPAFAPDAEAGLMRVQQAEAQASFDKLEERLRKSPYPRTEVEDLKALLVGPHAGVLSDATRLRIQLLIDLGTRMMATEDARRAKEGKKPVPPPADPKKKGRDEGDGRPPPPTASGTPGRRTYADERYRSRRGPRPAPPKVPGAGRPPSAASGRPSGGASSGTGLGR